VPGLEGAGIVEQIGEGVDEVAVGDRVAYAGIPPGAYAEVRCMPAHRLVKLPEGILVVKDRAWVSDTERGRVLLYRLGEIH